MTDGQKLIPGANVEIIEASGVCGLLLQLLPYDNILDSPTFSYSC